MEQGTHESLYALGGIYYSLVEKQRIQLKETDTDMKKDYKDEPEVVTQFISTGAGEDKKPSGYVAVDVGGNGMLAVPDARQMVETANQRRKAEKAQVKDSIFIVI